MAYYNGLEKGTPRLLKKWVSDGKVKMVEYTIEFLHPDLLTPIVHRGSHSVNEFDLPLETTNEELLALAVETFFLPMEDEFLLTVDSFLQERIIEDTAEEILVDVE